MKLFFRVVLLLICAWCTTVFANTITVTTLDDDFTDNGNCTLTEAVVAADLNSARDACAAGSAGLDRIEFSVSGTITQSLFSQPGIHTTITEDLIIDGANQITIRSSNTTSPGTLIFRVEGFNTQEVTFENLVIDAVDNLNGAISFVSNVSADFTLNNTDTTGTVSTGRGNLNILNSNITSSIFGIGSPARRNLTVSNSDVGGLDLIGDPAITLPTANIVNSTFRDQGVRLTNYSMVTVDISQFEGPDAILQILSSNLIMTNSSLMMSGATFPNAASLRVDVPFGSPIDDYTISIQNSTISGGTSDGINVRAVDINSMDVSIQSSTITANTGAGISVAGTTSSVNNGVALTIEDTTVSGNSGPGIAIGTGSAATVKRSQVSNNSGGLQTIRVSTFLNPSVTVENSTFSTNGAIGVNLRATDLTFRNNTVAETNGVTGARMEGPNIELSNNIFIGTTLSGNPSTDLVSDVYTGGFNLIGEVLLGSPSLPSDLIGADADLVPLADNGGPTMTHALGTQSQAINGGSNSLASGLSTDQRGQARIQSGVVDMGAFESALLPPSDGSIGDLVFQDFNGNGTMDGNDIGFADLTVQLFRDDGSVPNVLDENDTQIDTQTTNPTGNYDFQSLNPGNHLVNIPVDGVTALIGAQLTAGSNPRVVNLGAGQDFNDADFGFNPAALVLAEGPGNTNLQDQFAGTDDIVALHFSFTASAANTIVVEDITLTIAGDGDDEFDLEEVNLIRDINGNGIVDAGEPLLSTPRFFTADNGTLLFNAIDRPIAAGQTEFWIVTLNLGESACLCEDYRPALDSSNIVARIQGGAPITPVGSVNGRFVEITGGSLMVVSGNNQGGLVESDLPADMVVMAENQFPVCGDVEFTIRDLPDTVNEGIYPNGMSEFTVPLNASSQASTGFTFGETGGDYALRAQFDTQPAGCSMINDFTDFSQTAAGIALTDSLMSFRPAENQLRTFVQTIEAQNEFTVELAPADLMDFTLDEVSFALAGQSAMDTSAPFQTTFDMQDVMETDQLDVTITVTLPSGQQQTATIRGMPSSINMDYPVQAIGIPAWFNAVEFIAEGVTSEFDDSERKYKINFEYPTDFVWTEAVENVVALLGGAQSDLGGPGFRLMLEAGYDIDSNSSLSGGIERDITLFNRPVTLFGSVSAGFDQNFEFNSTDEPVGTIGASTAISLGEKSFGRTILVYGVPVTVAIDLGGELQVSAVGRVYLNENLEFSQLLLSPEPTIQLNAAASISALFGLAKAVATASPTAAGQIHLPYSTANGLESPRFGGRLTVDFMVEASVFFGLASAEVGSAMLGPYTWGDFIETRIDENFAMMQALQGLDDPESTFISTHALAGDASGRAMLIFTENVGAATPNPEILFQYDDGNGLGAAAPLRGTPTPDNRWEMDPAVTFLSNGDAVAMWTSNGGSPSLTQLGDIINEQEIAWSAWDSGSETWTIPADLTADNQADGSTDIDYDASNNQAIAVWVHDNNSTNDPLTRSDWEIHSAVFSESSSTWSAPIPVSNDNAADYMPAVASRNGTTIAVWSEDADGELFVDPGLPIGDDGTIDGGSNLDATNTDARLVFSSFNGSSWSAKQTLYSSASNTSYTQMADISGYDTERFIAVWVDKQATTDQLYYALYESGAWGTAVLLVESEQFIEEPTVTVDDFNEATIIYRSFDEQAGDGDGYTGNLFSQTLSLPTTRNVLNGPAIVQALTDDNNVQLFPVAALSGSETRLAWFDKTNANINIANTLDNSSALILGCTENAVDSDGDNLIDRLDLGVTATITSTGNFAIAGDLFDANGQFIAHAQTPTVFLPAGTRTVNVMFLSADIANSGNDGPYNLRNVSLSAAQPALLVIDAIPDVCTTSALAAVDFEPSPLRFDQARYAPGSIGNIILEFDSANTNPSTTDSVSVRVWSNLDTTGIQVTLTETGTNTGVFNGTVIFDPNTSDDITDRLLAPLGAALVTRYDDNESNAILIAEALIGLSEDIFVNGFE